EFMGNEKEFEQNIMDILDQIIDCLELPEIESVGRQKQIRFSEFQIIIDIIVRHKDDSATIFEVKKPNLKYPHTGTSEQVKAIGQLLLYQNIFQIKTGVKPRLALIDNKIFERTVFTFLNNELPI